MKRFVLLSIIVAIFIYAQDWQLVNPLPAGRADDIAIGYTVSEMQRLYIADQCSWPFISRNEGVSWDSLKTWELNSAKPIAIITDPDNAAHVWIARKDYGVFYSGNEGADWEWRGDGLTNLNIITLEMASDNPGVIFAGCEGASNMFKTTNGGVTWIATQNFPPTSNVYDIETPGAPYDILLAGCYNGVYRSTDGGNNWLLKYSGKAWDIGRDPSNDGHFYAAVIISDQGKVLRSTDFGNSWQEVLSLPAGQHTKKIAISPEPNWRIFVATENAGVYWKGPDPDPWHLSGPAEGLYDKLANSISLDIRSANFMVYASKTNVYTSVDFGNSWTPAVSGMRKTHPTSFSPSLPNAIYARGVHLAANPAGFSDNNVVKVCKSTNEGQDWNVVYSHTCYGTTDFPRLDSPRGPHTLVTHPQDALRVYVAFEWSQDFHVVSSTKDGGLTWHEENIGGACMYQAFAVDRLTEYAYLVNNEECVGDLNFMITTNSGEEWWKIGHLLPASDPISVISYPTTTGKIFLGTDKKGSAQGVHKSTNYGLEWAHVGLANNRISSFTINNLNNSIVYAGVEDGDLGVYKSLNDGLHDWTMMNSGLSYASVTALAADPEEPSIIILLRAQEVHLIPGKGIAMYQ